ncbi:membrane protein insertase YidC [Ectobacillus polymachus]|uniref:membrane protein insertase YidC n=1 Tax=Ectobacillus polymachus TaxID=1508806 RepID=UPI003A8922A3
MKKLLGMLPLTLVLFLAGCSSKATITPQSTGFWDHYFVYPISFIITSIAHLFHDNYGIGIIGITILIRLVTTPLVMMLNDNQWKMQQIQPEVKKLREKYSSKDQKTQQELNKEVMKLYQQHKINPAMGCLPAIVQMFILSALYSAIYRTKDIASHTFLWFSLGQVDPYHILPVLAAIATFFQYYAISKRPTTEGDLASKQMKTMMYTMPIMIFFMAFHLASAIGLYWVTGNTFMAIQTIFMEKRKLKKTQALQLNQEL